MKQGKFILTAGLCALAIAICSHLLVFWLIFIFQYLGNLSIPVSFFICYLIHAIYSSSEYRRQATQKDVTSIDSLPQSSQVIRGYSSPNYEYSLDFSDNSEIGYELYNDIHSNFIGDPTCIYNARSPFIRCAVNPQTDSCEHCHHYEMLER
jgi:hypothetical protein